ncbi:MULTISPECIES: hypothetical protein [unclassified Virgibacillus]|uniref:hypothetical protein n=1 Tax=unclassified Virgibacillus TaxID=2620237 RepID=UPI0024DEF02B|nr:hypothetical protein [Virgibacillus sp. LDC-1]
MRKAIIFIALLGLITLSACQQPSETVIRYQENFEIIGEEKEAMVGNISETIYDSIDRSNAAAKEVQLAPIAQDGEEVTLPEGRYQISGQITGNIYIRDEAGKLLFHEVIAPYPSGVERVTIDVNNSHTVRVDGFEEVFITPVATKLSTELTTGIWEVGKDVKEGIYRVASSGFGSFIIFKQGESPRVHELFSSHENRETTFDVHLQKGQRIIVSGATMVQLEKKGK